MFVFVFLFWNCSQHGEKLTFNGTEIYYKDGATINDAVNLGEYLVSSGFTKDGKRISLQIFKNGKIYVVRMVTQKGKENDSSVIESIRTISSEMAKDVFKIDKSNIEFHLCDDRFHSLRVITYNSSYIPK